MTHIIVCVLYQFLEKVKQIYSCFNFDTYFKSSDSVIISFYLHFSYFATICIHTKGLIMQQMYLISIKYSLASSKQANMA